MSVYYIFSKFPVKSQAFAVAELNVCNSLGLLSGIFTIANADNAHFQEDQVILKKTKSANILRYLAGAVLCLSSPISSFKYLKVVWGAPGKNKEKILFSALMPLGAFVARECARLGVRHVHSFWGKWPLSLVLYSKIRDPEIRATTFLGAYDLTDPLKILPSILNSMDLVTTHAQVNVEEIERLGVPRNKIHLCYRGVNLERLKVYREKKQGKENRLVIAGRLTHGKKIVELLRVLIQHDLWKTTDLRVDVCGDGPLREELYSLIKGNERVKFHGHVTQNDFFSILSGAKYFALASTHVSERLPNVVKEAMYMSCVVFVTPTPGIQELVTESTGYICEDLHALVDQIFDHVAADSSCGTDMANRASESIVSSFSFERNLKEFYSRVST